MFQTAASRGLAVLLAFAVALAACGGDDEPGAETAVGDSPADGDAGAQEVTIAAEDTEFDTSEVTLSGGPATITFENRDEGVPHNLRITGAPGEPATEIAEGPGSDTLEVDLDAGEYEFVCDVHPDRMTGTLVVEA